MLTVYLATGDCSHDVIGGGQSNGRSGHCLEVRMGSETRL